MPDIQQIALAFPRGAHQEIFIQGVLKYAREAECDWSYITTPESLALSVLDLKGWRGDGILAAINTEKEVDCAKSMPMPVVNISSALPGIDLPTSMVDNAAIGRMAADHLIGKGFQSYAYYGLRNVQYSVDRQLGFERRLGESGYEYHGFYAEATFGLKGHDWLTQHKAVAEWLSSLPTPCGLFAVSDYRARQVLDACRHERIHVPEKLAVVGVDNEQVICEHANPPLTSVARNDELEGYRAAELLHQLLQGRSPDSDPDPVAPVQIVERESTSTYAVSDSRLRCVLDYVHENLGDPITVDELTQYAGVSRRWLEYAFRDAVGETPYQYLRRQRLALARRLLLSERKLKVAQVALRSGFTSAKQLTSAFQQEYGVSPRTLRSSVNMP